MGRAAMRIARHCSLPVADQLPLHFATSRTYPSIALPRFSECSIISRTEWRRVLCKFNTHTTMRNSTGASSSTCSHLGISSPCCPNAAPKCPVSGLGAVRLGEVDTETKECQVVPVSRAQFSCWITVEYINRTLVHIPRRDFHPMRHPDEFNGGSDRRDSFTDGLTVDRRCHNNDGLSRETCQTAFSIC